MNVVRFEEQSLKEKTTGCRETHRTRSNIRYVEKTHQDLGRRVEVGTNELGLSDKLTLQLMKTCLPRKQLTRSTRGRMLRGRRLHLAKRFC